MSESKKLKLGLPKGSLQESTIEIFRRAGISNLGDLRVFEAGCSTGYNLRQMVQWGGSPANM